MDRRDLLKGLALSCVPASLVAAKQVNPTEDFVLYDVTENFYWYRGRTYTTKLLLMHGVPWPEVDGKYGGKAPAVPVYQASLRATRREDGSFEVGDDSVVYAPVRIQEFFKSKGVPC